MVTLRNGDKLNLTEKNKNFFGDKIFNIIGHNSFKLIKIEYFTSEYLVSYILTGINDNKSQVLSEYIKK